MDQTVLEARTGQRGCTWRAVSVGILVMGMYVYDGGKGREGGNVQVWSGKCRCAGDVFMVQVVGRNVVLFQECTHMN